VTVASNWAAGLGIQTRTRGSETRLSAIIRIVRLVTAAIRSIERLSRYEAAHRRSRSPQYQLRSATEEASRL